MAGHWDHLEVRAVNMLPAIGLGANGAVAVLLLVGWLAGDKPDKSMMGAIALNAFMAGWFLRWVLT